MQNIDKQIIDNFIAEREAIKSTEDYNKVISQIVESLISKDPNDEQENKFKLRSKVKEVIIDNFGEILKGLDSQQAFEITTIAQKMSSMEKLTPILEYLELYSDNIPQFSKELNEAVIKGLSQLIVRNETINITEVKDLLLKLKNAGADLETSIASDGVYTSLLTATLLNPTEQNFEIFKYLVEELGVKMENNLSSQSLEFDNQKPTENQEAIKKFLDYIDANTTNEQKNRSQLINLAFFYNYKELFEKLLSNEEIKIDNTTARGGSLLSDIYMRPDRNELSETFLKSDKITVEQTGPLKEGYLYQMKQYFSLLEKENPEDRVKINSLFELAVKKVQDYPTIQEEQLAALKLMSIESNQDSKYFLKFYNLHKVDSSKILFDRMLLATLPVLESEFFNSTSMKLVFFTNPSLLEDLAKAAKSSNIDYKSGPKEKLLYILECTKELKGLDLKMYGNAQHIEILKTLNTLSGRELENVANHLDFKSKDEISTYINDLKQLSKNDPKILPALEKLEEVMIDKIELKIDKDRLKDVVIKVNLGFFAKTFNFLNELLNLKGSNDIRSPYRPLKPLELKQYLQEDTKVEFAEKLKEIGNEKENKQNASIAVPLVNKESYVAKLTQYSTNDKHAASSDSFIDKISTQTKGDFISH